MNKNFRARGVFVRDAKIMDDSELKDRVIKQNWEKKYENLIDFRENKFTWLGMHNQSEQEQFLDRNKFIQPSIKGPDRKADFTEDVNEYLLKLGIKDYKNPNKMNAIDMYPAEKELKELIYKGVSKEDEGRLLYLKERKKQAPETRYAFPVTSSMDVGWRLYDENSKLQCNFFKEAKKIDDSTSYKTTAIGEFPSIYGIRNVMWTSFSRENGVLSDNYKDDVIKVRIN